MLHFIFLLKTHDVVILTVVIGLSQNGSSEMGDFTSFRLNLVSALTVGLVRSELSNFRLKAKIDTEIINAVG